MATEKGLFKLQENFSCYQDKLSDELIFKYIQVYLNKAKKIGKMEVKVKLEITCGLHILQVPNPIGTV